MIRSSLGSREKAGRPARLEKNHPEGGAEEGALRDSSVSVTERCATHPLSSSTATLRPPPLPVARLARLAEGERREPVEESDDVGVAAQRREKPDARPPLLLAHRLPTSESEQAVGALTLRCAALHVCKR